jgi:hypothetical protein
MNVLFEDDGQLKAGAVLADQDTSLMVEAASGKRTKVKAGSVLLRFASPGASEVLGEAHRLASELDPTSCGRRATTASSPSPTSRASITARAPRLRNRRPWRCCCTPRPMHFYKKGKGRYRKAPPDALRAALASVERKAREGEQIAAWVSELAQNRLPDALRARLPMLLYEPDKNALEWKALNAACEARKTNPVELLAACGAIPSTHDYHFGAFVAQAFPRGLAFAPWGTLPAVPELPRSDARAFSIDDASTTEIDDAFSVRELANGNYEVGIHIACPALAIARDGPLDNIARERLSTVYMPGRKLTMLPDEAIGAFTLKAGTSPPALTLAIEVSPDGVPLAPRDARRARARRGEPAPGRGNGCLRQRAAQSRRPAVDARASRAVETRTALGRCARQERYQPHRLQLRRRLGRRARRAGFDRAARAGQPSRQADRRAHDPREQYLGEVARRPRRRRPLPGAIGGQGEDEHAPPASTRAWGSCTTCGRARRCGATATS